MKIHKVINNNVISVINEHNKELVIMGRGIAFKKKPGDPVDEDSIEKIFTLENKDLSERFKTLLYEIPVEYMEISDEIISYAKKALGRKLNESIYVSLTDHIHFAVERHQKGLDIKNALLWEIKRLYKEEYEVGVKALQRIKEKLNISLPEDEAGFIALHIVNAELNDEMTNIVNITKVMQEILNIVKYHFKIDFDEESLNYYRFITHLKFFAQRLFNKTYMDNEDDFLYDVIKEKYREAYRCTEKIREFISKKYNYDINAEEMVYLTIHIARVVTRN
ncbi:BglG family transcription antiterminator LicT [Mesobacillus foraminis]|uniref:BglG family transcriptional antiterminator n=1 Tax=Mesobacillus foraminis TaxID=279826 RepID=A0A4R2B487_9BACI|nr:PRD domain-containing protein [Mesobacillus foraminis]TCN21427.1 BglG family transcriptional antiterminator [Mesobacillus foraminis]